MAKDDWGIVIGITHYPGLKNLRGPENDARSFYEWLIGKSGGNVPKEQITLVVSSRFRRTNDPFEAKPNDREIAHTLESLEEISKRNDAQGHGKRVGRRLYIYMAGHGFDLTRDLDTYTVLLTANAQQERAGHHVAGELWAKVYAAGRFDEVFLLMDCCRQRLHRVPLQQPPFGPNGIPDLVPRLVVALGAQWSQKAYEKRFGSKINGVFTKALLTGLRGAASDPNGDITVRSLAGYLKEGMRALLAREEILDPDISKEPEVDADGGDNIVIATIPQTKFKVEIRVRPQDAGKALQIFDKQLHLVYQGKVVAGVPAAVGLPAGLYRAQVVPHGNEQGFELPGTGVGGTAHVAL